MEGLQSASNTSSRVSNHVRHRVCPAAAPLTLLRQSCDPIPTLMRQPSASLLRLWTCVWKASSHCARCRACQSVSFEQSQEPREQAGILTMRVAHLYKAGQTRGGAILQGFFDVASGDGHAIQSRRAVAVWLVLSGHLDPALELDLDALERECRRIRLASEEGDHSVSCRASTRQKVVDAFHADAKAQSADPGVASSGNRPRIALGFHIAELFERKGVTSTCLMAVDIAAANAMRCNTTWLGEGGREGGMSCCSRLPGRTRTARRSLFCLLPSQHPAFTS